MSYLKTAIVLAILGLSSLLSMPATAKEKIVEGYYIRRASTQKIKTTFFITGKGHNFLSMQKGIDFLDSRWKRRTLLPTEADEFGFIYKNDTVVMRSVYDNLTTQTDLFLHTFVDGIVCYYELHEYKFTPPNTVTGGGGGGVTSHAVLQHSNGELVKIRDLFFRKDLADFFADCPALVKKITEGAHKKITDYAKEYNRSCRQAP